MLGLSEEYRVLFEGGFAVADECLARAIRSIDLRFGQGYAKSHPELVAMYMQVAAQEFNTSSSQKRQRDLVQAALSRLRIMLEEVLDRFPARKEGEEIFRQDEQDKQDE